MNSIAVLPFVNTNGDPDTEYLVDGVTESLIDRLSELPDLKIMARSTVFRFKGSEQDPREIGRKLGVAAVLSGRVDLRGETLVIGTELIQVADGSQIWGERFNRPMDDLLQVEGEISRTLADKLELELTGTQKDNLDRTLEVDPEAYRAYLRGMYDWNRRTKEDLERGNARFEEAIRLDPGFALAYAGLANGYLVLGNWGWIDPHEAKEAGKRNVLRALELDPNIAEAHAALGGIYSEHDWDWPRAEIEFRAALELKPGYATGHQWYAEFLMGMLRIREAREHFDRALELDPLSLIAQTTGAFSLIHEKDWEAFSARIDRILEVDPSFMPAWGARMQGAMAMARDAETLESFLQLARMSSMTDSTKIARMVEAGGRGDYPEAYRVGLEEYEAAAKHEYVSPLILANLSALAGEIDRAFAYLEQAYADRVPGMIYVRVPGQLPDKLKSDPRWDALIARMHFPPVPEEAGS
jgi:TolB-like protein/tetratricopeptide (TPR) repeat protein